jgi:choline dehydrogenase
LSYRVPIASSIHVLQKRPFAALKAFLEYLAHGTGLFTSPVTEYTYFLHSDRYPHPTTDIENNPYNLENVANIELAWIGAWGSAESKPPKLGKYGFNTILVQGVRPKSTGSIILVNRDARTPPLVDPNYLGSDEDLEMLKKGIEYGLDIGRKMMATDYDMAEELVPKNKASVDEFVRSVATGAYHLSSTCRMAKREEGGVVDQQLRVYGVKGLRIADASIFPRLIGVKPQATIVLVGEKCADLILGR